MSPHDQTNEDEMDIESIISKSKSTFENQSVTN